MFTVAGQLHFVFDMSFWMTYVTVGFGELLSMTIGGIIDKEIGLDEMRVGYFLDSLMKYSWLKEFSKMSLILMIP